jgi:ribonuclease VapC
MMVDASAILAILSSGPDGPSLAAQIEAAKAPFTSPVAVHETVAALMRENQWTAAEAEPVVREFLAIAAIRVVMISDSMASLAIAALDRYGEGRHPVGLNLGQCFAYACARAYRVPLLYNSDAFSKTDVNDHVRAGVTNPR